MKTAALKASPLLFADIYRVGRIGHARTAFCDLGRTLILCGSIVDIATIACEQGIAKELAGSARHVGGRERISHALIQHPHRTGLAAFSSASLSREISGVGACLA